ncbi:MAG: YicC family protein [Bdellovibrionales bacterium]|nr:YicC family protein [Bdellovibrionales bacterium]
MKQQKIFSMTGFGSAQGSTRHISIEASLKSVNGRFLEVRFHLPKEYIEWEPEIRSLLSQSLIRGTVDLYVHRQIKPQVQLQPKINLKLAEGLVKAYRQLAKINHLDDQPNLSHLIQNSALLSWEPLPLEKLEKNKLFQVIQTALKSCLEQKKREGCSLYLYLEQLLSSLDQCLEKMKSLAQQNQELLQKRITLRLEQYPPPQRETISQIKSLSPSESQRMIQELAFYLDRSDVTEELHRLGEHLKHFRNLLSTQSVVGKKMDFYCQELLREVNTVGSKASLAQLTEVVVEGKSIIEKIKEQVQNVV